MAPSGGRLSLKRMLAPHVNITIVSPNGITDHTISSARPVCWTLGSSCSDRRRYLTAKIKIAMKISTVKNVATASRKYVRWSTSGANVDACSGNRASLPIANDRPASTGCKRFFVRAEIPAEHDQQEHAADQCESRSGKAHHVHRHGAVLARCRVVMETEQQQGIDRVADLVLRGFHQPEPHVAR